MLSHSASLSAASTAAPSEERFCHDKHSSLMLTKMEQYFKSGKLRDVILIAGIKNHYATKLLS